MHLGVTLFKRSPNPEFRVWTAELSWGTWWLSDEHTVITGPGRLLGAPKAAYHYDHRGLGGYLARTNNLVWLKVSYMSRNEHVESKINKEFFNCGEANF